VEARQTHIGIELRFVVLDVIETIVPGDLASVGAGVWAVTIST